MKIAACYTVFDGLELLEPSLLNMSKAVDIIIICWSKVSNKGRIDSDLYKKLSPLEQHSDIYLVEYHTDISLNPKENERRKHNLMVNAARAHRATHFIMAATDHFYHVDEIEYGKKIVESMNFDVTFTAMYTYYKKPTWQLIPLENYYMPFICKLSPETKIERVKGYPLLVDPSVQISPLGRWYLFKEFEVMLHHYSVVRLNMREKFENAASPWKAIQIEQFVHEWICYDINDNPGVTYFSGRKVQKVPDFFNLNSIFGF